MVLAAVVIEKQVAAVAVTDPIAQNPTATKLIGLVIASFMCGAMAITTIAEIGIRLQPTNSLHTDAATVCRVRQIISSKTPEYRITRMRREQEHPTHFVIGEPIGNKKPATYLAAGFCTTQSLEAFCADQLCTRSSIGNICCKFNRLISSSKFCCL